MDNPNPWKLRPIEIDLPALWERLGGWWKETIAESETCEEIED